MPERREPDRGAVLDPLGGRVERHARDRDLPIRSYMQRTLCIGGGVVNDHAAGGGHRTPSVTVLLVSAPDGWGSVRTISLKVTIYRSIHD